MIIAERIDMNNLLNDNIKAWIGRISMLLALSFMVYIYMRNRLNYMLFKNKFKKPNSQSSYVVPKWLNIWSQTVFISSIFGVIIFSSTDIPYLCEYTYYLSSAAVVFPHVFLSYFQTARLQLSFNDNINCIGYPSYLFKILYAIGVPILLFSATYIFFTSEPYELSNYNGCFYVDKFYVFGLTFCLYFVYLIWDLTIVTLYIYKLCQLKTTIRGKNHATIKVLQKINLTLSKIVFLTLCYEIAVTPLLILDFLGILGRSFGWSLDFILVGYVIYLMLEHNSNDFIKLLYILHKFRCQKCCCCCFGNIVSSDYECGNEDENMQCIEGGRIDNDVLDQPKVAVVRNKFTFTTTGQLISNDIDTIGNQTVMDLVINKQIYRSDSDTQMDFNSTAL
eukprot:468737_1